MTLSVEELRKTALLKQDKNISAPITLEELERREQALLADPEIATHILQLEEHCKEFAAEGHMHFDYKFADPSHTIELMTKVSQAFKKKHPYFMVVTFYGQMKINIDWSGKHEC